jgi:SNF2 family DNA or RNA helicase
MHILHGSWIPSAADEFIQTGGFYLWVEVAQPASSSKRSLTTGSPHPGQLSLPELADFLGNFLELEGHEPVQRYIALPTSNHRPLPAPELARYLELELPDRYDEICHWRVNCYEVGELGDESWLERPCPIVLLLQELQLLAMENARELQLGTDLQFWYHYSQACKAAIYKDQYIPALKYRQLGTPASKTKTKPTAPAQFEIYAAWELISQQYEDTLQRYVQHMPLLCAAGAEVVLHPPPLHDPLSLLRHFSECLLNNILLHTPSTAKFEKQVANSPIQLALQTPSPAHTRPKSSPKRSRSHPSAARTNPQQGEAALAQYQQWLTWKKRLVRSQNDAPFDLCFQLHSAPAQQPDRWQLEFLAVEKQSSSQRLALGDYWPLSAAKKTTWRKRFGQDFENLLLINLGHAARIYPKIWQGLQGDRPSGLELTLTEAFDFLQESSWVLEDAGFKVLLPAWYTPAGRRRAKLRLVGRSPSQKTKSAGSGFFGLGELIDYQYELAIGDEVVSQAEWAQLVQATMPLVQFRGEWVELDRDKMQQMLEFWQKQDQGAAPMSLLEVMQRSAQDEFEVAPQSILADLMAKLQDKSKLTAIGDLPNLQGTLREYQKRGVSWIHYLEELGLNGCLADDMGLGKSITVIGRLVQERNGLGKPKKGQKPSVMKPTLLIAPTSVVGNWQREIAKFAPQLQSIIHHGSDRLSNVADFQKACVGQDVVISSYGLVRRDAELFKGVSWHRVVIDEAQNIKNPQAAQTKAILKIEANHRLALTGTPVENRLLDLWSIFNFLNPGYLGKEAQFRKGFEEPIQRNEDPGRAATLKKLVEPLILRRVKTDPKIIQDLPDKVEQKLFTNLTKEQAALYEAVVQGVEKELQSATGIQRKGLMLSTLMRLKQICNHPAQFLQDGSHFGVERSHKLSRLTEMVTEAIEAGESLLIFSQFTEICAEVERYCRQTLYFNTYYLHGGTSRAKREQMIQEFQDPEAAPAVFVLSLKAGGVGITLTKANHVFHFDRWWNPAVEDQASDRAFRIGQTKNVFVHKFVTSGTLEERIDQMIEDKKKLASSIVGADESWLTKLDNHAFQELIALNRSSIMEVE